MLRQEPPHVLDAEIALQEGLGEVTGGRALTVERRSAGASRAGYAVDVTLADGSIRELWLRVDTGHGPVELLAPAAVVRGVEQTYGAVPELGEGDERIRAEFG